ncbi:hypothetical protein SSE37_10487 [Sagittula stellata E-37]|uniref:Uncharacterized protein n=1 Tax=Sagittula stellata (strain ATCC 700073 / DSM 11524 / E-37) TaxID=388399 RepID=A3K9T0_SAGS3|nr:hypothetical protein SSE37_10487 [Sagittula stellata E-37]
MLCRRAGVFGRVDRPAGFEVLHPDPHEAG